MIRRISIGRLGLIHAAVRDPACVAAHRVTLEEAEGLEIGTTFAETLEFNRSRLDLYESHPEILRITPVGKVLVRWPE